MEFLAHLWLPTLLSAVVVWFWSILSRAVLGLSTSCQVFASAFVSSGEAVARARWGRSTPMPLPSNSHAIPMQSPCNPHATLALKAWRMGADISATALDATIISQ
jgi:hypothetical protein